jgi:trimethylamine:corrinoid methyltransferase-like protein
MTQLMAMSGAAIIGDLGALETCMIASPLLMIIANDLVAMAGKLKEGLVIDDVTLGFQELLAANEDGVFLDLEHTYNHFREICSPKTFNRAPRELWEKEGGKDLIARARDEYRTLKEKHQPVNHPEEVLKEFDAIAARASKELAG